jgi:pyruvate dehydrogenase E2 component (dihydrolipoamide acetyltransferase)
MDRVFAMPDLGEGLEEGEIVAWLVAEGDTVELNQPLVEIETAKATVEVPSPYAGVVVSLHADVGGAVAVGGPLVTFAVSGGGGGGGGSAGQSPPNPRSTTAAPVHPPGGRTHGASVTATPAVRKVARDLGVDLSSVTGSGPGGRISREDVEAAGAGGALSPSGDHSDERISATRRAIAANLSKALAEVPQVDTFRTVECSGIEAVRGEIGVSPLAVVARALVDVCSRHPLLNASYLAAEGVIRSHHQVHLGVATHTERGLVVVVVRDAGSLGIVALGNEIRRLAGAARENTLAPADVTGATLSISNTGSYGSEWGTPLVIPPQGAILGLGRIAPRALVVDADVRVLPACTISLGFDHRLLDGYTAGQALTNLVDLLEDPARLRDLPA